MSSCPASSSVSSPPDCAPWGFKRDSCWGGGSSQRDAGDVFHGKQKMDRRKLYEGGLAFLLWKCRVEATGFQDDVERPPTMAEGIRRSSWRVFKSN